MKKYNEEHEWLEVEDGVASIGISEYAVEQLGDITYIELPEVGTDINKGESIAFIESVKAASDVYAPISGEVIEVNEALIDVPESLNGGAEVIWILKIKLSNESELDALMDSDAYAQYVKTL